MLQDINLEFPDGEFVVLIGPSGCGKTTILRLIAGLEEQDSGDVLIAGENVNTLPPAKRSIAMVFQSLSLYPHMNVAANIGFPLKIAGTSKSVIREKVAAVAKMLQMEHLLERRPSQLSGGEKQRVAIGRAMVRDPKVFLFDEPLSNLDVSLRAQMRMELKELHEKLKSTMLYVTHDQTEAMTLGERIVVINDHVVQQMGRPIDLYESPANTFVAGFFGAPRINLLEATLLAADEKLVTVRLADGLTVQAAVDARSARIGDKVIFGLRPEHVRLASVDEDETLAGRVHRLEHLGDMVHVYVALPGVDEKVCVKVKAGSEYPQNGAQVDLAFPVKNSLLFDAAGVAFARTT
ncbi:MAG: ABC transporter ATP-binding protein [Formivibrio sp.]|nr:ABC transporter ATP-binding protein [Formivibrio sp.]